MLRVGRQQLPSFGNSLREGYAGDDYGSTDFRVPHLLGFHGCPICPGAVRELCPTSPARHDHGPCARTPIYNCHSYLTKVPIAPSSLSSRCSRGPERCRRFLRRSGMTGLAAAMTGRRRPLATSRCSVSILRGDTDAVAPAQIQAASRTSRRVARRKLGDLTRRRRRRRRRVEMVRTIWSFVYRCPDCGTDLVYYRALGQQGGRAGPESMSGCLGPSREDRGRNRRRSPVRVVVDSADGNESSRSFSSVGLATAIAAADSDPGDGNPFATNRSRRARCSAVPGLGRAGIRRENARFFSSRNAIALRALACDWDGPQTRSSAKAVVRLHRILAACFPPLPVEAQSTAQRTEPNLLHRARLLRMECVRAFERKIEAANPRGCGSCLRRPRFRLSGLAQKTS